MAIQSRNSLFDLKRSIKITRSMKLVLLERVLLMKYDIKFNVFDSRGSGQC